MKKTICTVMILVAMMTTAMASERTITQRITSDIVNGFGNIHRVETHTKVDSVHAFEYTIKAFGTDVYVERHIIAPISEPTRA